MLSRSLFKQAIPRAVSVAKPAITSSLPRFSPSLPSISSTRLTVPRASFSTTTTMAQAASGPPDFKNYSEEQWTEGVHNIVNKEMWDAAISSPALVVVDFFATWCGPCKAIAPQIVNFSKSYKNTRFIKVDVDDLPDIAQELGIKAMPTFVFYKGGEKIQEVVGANPKAVEQVLSSNA